MFCGLFKAERLKGGNNLRWLNAAVTVHAREKEYANMLLDINGKMVRRVRAASPLCVRLMCSVLTLTVVSCLQVSATEECVGPMRLTQEPIQVRAKLPEVEEAD